MPVINHEAREIRRKLLQEFLSKLTEAQKDRILRLGLATFIGDTQFGHRFVLPKEEQQLREAIQHRLDNPPNRLEP